MIDNLIRARCHSDRGEIEQAIRSARRRDIGERWPIIDARDPDADDDE
jgi:hypothetical protein